MANWDKNTFIDHLRKNCTREIAKIGVSIIELVKDMQMIFPGVEAMITEP